MLFSRNPSCCFCHFVDGLTRRKRSTFLMLATSFAEAAGVAGRQKWGLVLSSSARVSQVTYQTVVGVRYHELVTFNGTSWNFGKFITHERPQRGSFLPVFWNVLRADTHAVEDIGAVVEWLTERCAMLMPSLALMSPSSTCLSRTAACQAYTSLRRQLWKFYRTMSPTIIRYGGCISLWWTCGGHGSTILPGPEKSLISTVAHSGL